jgi:hypothetical protein
VGVRAHLSPLDGWWLVRPALDLPPLLAWLDRRGVNERALHHELTEASPALLAADHVHLHWLRERQDRLTSAAAAEDHAGVAARDEVRHGGRDGRWRPVIHSRDKRPIQVRTDYTETQAARMAPRFAELRRLLAAAGVAGVAAGPQGRTRAAPADLPSACAELRRLAALAHGEGGETAAAATTWAGVAVALHRLRVAGVAPGRAAPATADNGSGDDSDASDAADAHDDDCAVCAGAGELLMCDGCPRVYHLACHAPPLRRVPRFAWTCSDCVRVCRARVV